nr:MULTISPECIES: antibiotic biosynthesis monooxygenase [Neorhizobium]
MLRLVSPSRKEEGCLRYETHQSNDVPDAWMMLEDWRHASDFKLNKSATRKGLVGGTQFPT